MKIKSFGSNQTLVTFQMRMSILPYETPLLICGKGYWILSVVSRPHLHVSLQHRQCSCSE